MLLREAQEAAVKLTPLCSMRELEAMEAMVRGEGDGSAFSTWQCTRVLLKPLESIQSIQA